MTEKEIFSGLFDMSSDELYEMFKCESVEDVVNNVDYSVIIRKLSEPRYGDVYEFNESCIEKRGVFLGENKGKYLILFESEEPRLQTYTPSNFKAWYIKTGNVADKLKGLFE